MASYNRATVIGNVVRDIEIKELSGDYQVGNLSLAINDKRKDRNGQCVQETTYVDVQLWNNTAKAVQTYAPKGKSVLIEVRLKTNTWEQNGQKRSKLILVGEKVVFLGQKGGKHLWWPDLVRTRHLQALDEASYCFGLNLTLDWWNALPDEPDEPEEPEENQAYEQQN